jgi:hypothetical protein
MRLSITILKHYTYNNATDLYAEYSRAVCPVFHCYAQCNYAECNYAECLNAECLYAECLYAECLYAECLYAECLYADCLYAECLYADCLYAECLYSDSLYAECLYAECLCAECRGLCPRSHRAYILFKRIFLYSSYFPALIAPITRNTCSEFLEEIRAYL